MYPQIRMEMETKRRWSKRLLNEIYALCRKGQYAEAKQLLEPFAEAGRAEAQYQMGELLFRKMLDKEDYTNVEEVATWYEKAAMQQYANAILALADLYVPERDYSKIYPAAVKGKPKLSPTFKLKPNLDKALSLYAQAYEVGDKYLWSMKDYLIKILDDPDAPHEMKDKIINFMFDMVGKGCKPAAEVLLHLWWRPYARLLSKQKNLPESYDLHMTMQELFQAKWFRLLLDEKEDSSMSAVLVLRFLVEQFNSTEALDLLTQVALKGNAIAADIAGKAHYKQGNYESALACFHISNDHHMLGHMYENGEGTDVDQSRAFHYYLEIDDYANLGRMYEHHTAVDCDYTDHDLQKAYDYYRKALVRGAWWFPIGSKEEEAEKYKRICQGIRRMKEFILEGWDNIGIQVKTSADNAVCAFTVSSCDDCPFIVSWGDGTVQRIDNKQGGDLHIEHTFAKKGTWDINLTSVETHTITGLHYTDTTCLLTRLDVSDCPILADLYCPDQVLRSLNVSQNPRLERLVCRNNRLRTLHIEKNIRLTQLDCSGNKDLSSIYWKTNSPLRKLCFDLHQLSPHNGLQLKLLLKLNNGELTGPMPETPLEHLSLWLAYYIRCSNWAAIKKIAAEKVYYFDKQPLGKRKPAFEAIHQMAMDAPRDDAPFGLSTIKPRGRFGCDEKQYVSFYADYSPNFSQDFEDTNLYIYPWAECLAMPVDVKEYDGWLMLPQTGPTVIAATCFCAMTNWYLDEPEEKAEEFKDYMEFRRKADEYNNDRNLK